MFHRIHMRGRGTTEQTHQQKAKLWLLISKIGGKYFQSFIHEQVLGSLFSFTSFWGHKKIGLKMGICRNQNAKVRITDNILYLKANW
jgi:hypothetical protein